MYHLILLTTPSLLWITRWSTDAEFTKTATDLREGFFFVLLPPCVLFKKFFFQKDILITSCAPTFALPWWWLLSCFKTGPELAPPWHLLGTCWRVREAAKRSILKTVSIAAITSIMWRAATTSLQRDSIIIRFLFRHDFLLC